MKKVLKLIFPQLYTKMRVAKLLVLREDSFLYTVGWFNSIKEMKPIGMSNEPVPWMNYSFVDFLTPRLKSDFNMFEFGSGNSTVYFSKRVNNITSIEYDKDWFQIVLEQVNHNNVKLLFIEKDTNGKYCRAAINTGVKYDVILVDGRDRVNCLEKSVDALGDYGVLILDDSHEMKYSNAFSILTTLGFKSITITGFKPCSQILASTTIFYKVDNCLGI